MADTTNIDKNVNILDEISQHVSPVKRGKNYFIICPFHDDTKPSLSISPEKNMFKCFTCGAAGGTTKLYSKLKNIDIEEGMVQLSEKYNIRINYKQDIKYSQFKHIYDLNVIANEFYRFSLLSTHSGAKALKYLETRQINQELIDYFEIGFAPIQKDALSRLFIENEWDFYSILESHLCKKNDKTKSYYDYFTSRITIPIKDTRGKIIGFGGRTLSKNDSVKYLNSPEGKIFKKSDILFNYHNAKNYTSKYNSIILCEGYMDVIAVNKTKYKNVVASMGTALTDNQINNITKLSNNIILSFDGDNAGKEATIKAIKKLLKHNLNIKVFPLENEDPDDYIKSNGIEAFETTIENNLIDEVDFLFIYFTSSINKSSINDINQSLNTILDIIKNKNNTIKEYLINKFNKKFDVNLSLPDKYKTNNFNDNSIPQPSVETDYIDNYDYGYTDEHLDNNNNLSAPPLVEDYYIPTNYESFDENNITKSNTDKQSLFDPFSNNSTLLINVELADRENLSRHIRKSIYILSKYPETHKSYFELSFSRSFLTPDYYDMIYCLKSYYMKNDDYKFSIVQSFMSSESHKLLYEKIMGYEKYPIEIPDGAKADYEIKRTIRALSINYFKYKTKQLEEFSKACINEEDKDKTFAELNTLYKNTRTTAQKNRARKR